MTKKIYCFVLFFLLGSMGMGAFAQGERLRANTHMTDSIHGYYEYLPLTYDENKPKGYPLFLFLNGTGSTGDGSEESLKYLYSGGNLYNGPIHRLHRQTNFPSSFTVEDETFEFIYICPQFVSEPYWDGWDWAPEIDRILDYCIATYNVDTNRIYLAGQSMGSGYMLNYITRSDAYAKRIAAVGFAAVNMIIGQNQKGYGKTYGRFINKNRIGTWFAGALQDSSASFDSKKWIYDNVDSIMAGTPTPEGIYVPKITLVEGSDHGESAQFLFDPFRRQDGYSLYEWMLLFTKESTVPVTGLEITARTSGNSIDVNWSTVSEHGSSTYELERRGENNEFQTIYTVASQNSPMGAQYAYTDNKPLSGVNSYRIKQIDMDGKTTYSKVVTATFASTTPLKVYPNPASSRVTVEVAGRDRIVSIKIYDQAGKLHREISGSKTNREDINVSAFPKGVYIGKVISDSGTSDFTFIKK